MEEKVSRQFVEYLADQKSRLFQNSAIVRVVI